MQSLSLKHSRQTVPGSQAVKHICFHQLINSFMFLISLTVFLLYCPKPVFSQNTALDKQHSSLNKPSLKNATVSTTSASATVLSKGEKAFLLNEQGVELVFKGRQKEGLGMINEAYELDPSNSTILYNLAGIYLSQGKAPDAIKMMEKAIALQAEDLSFWNRLAEAHLANKDVEAAILNYEKIIAKDPKYDEALLRLGTLYGLKEDWDKAELVLRQAKSINADNIEALSNLGSILVVREKFEEAIQVLTQVYSSSKTAETALALAVAYEGQGDVEKSISFYEEAKKLGSNDPNLEEHLAYIKKQQAGDAKPGK